MRVSNEISTIYASPVDTKYRFVDLGKLFGPAAWANGGFKSVFLYCFRCDPAASIVSLLACIEMDGRARQPIPNSYAKNKNMIFRNVFFRAELSSDIQSLLDRLSLFKKLKGYDAKIYSKGSNFFRARMQPIWLERRWIWTDDEVFWQSTKPTEFEGYLAEGEMLKQFEESIANGGAAEVLYQYRIENLDSYSYADRYSHGISLGPWRSNPLELRISLSSTKDQVKVEKERAKIIELVQKHFPQLQDWKIKLRNGIVSVKTLKKQTNGTPDVAFEHSGQIVVRACQVVIDEIRVVCDVEQRNELFKQFHSFCSAAGSEFSSRRMTVNVWPSSMAKLKSFEDVSLLGEGEFILHGGIIPKFDFENMMTTESCRLIPIGQLESKSSGPDIDLQLIRADSGKFFIEFSPVCYMLEKADIDKCQSGLEKIWGAKFARFEGDTRYRWADLVS